MSTEPAPERERHADIVGDVIDDEYVSVTEDTFVGIAVERFLEFEPENEAETTIYYVYVTDGEDRLVGIASFRELVNAASDPLITTVKDVTALVIYFGLATILIGV